MHCFYHNDHDGRGAGAIVAQFEGDYNKENYFEVDYIMDLTPMLDAIQEGERVYFVDYSFKESTKWILERLQNINCDIVWIDHHTSSINLETQYPKLKNIRGIRQDKISGMALTYMYLYSYKFDELPYYVKLISDYDCWQFKYEPDTTYFKLGIETKPYDALDDVWKLLDSDFFDYSCEGENRVWTLIRIGKTIKTYIDADNTQYRNQWAYESIIGGHKAMVINRKSNSWIFGEKYDQYPLVCVWAFNGERYSYSIFSGDTTVDCSKIAESYGGGGHKGAAGFSSTEMLFRKTV